MIDASVLLYFSFDSSFSQSRSMGQAVPTVHLTFYRLAAVIRDMSDEQLEQLAPWSETAKTNCQN